MGKKKLFIFTGLILGFSVLFSFFLKWAQTGNPFQSETILYGSVIFINALITGSIAYRIFRIYSSKSPIEYKRIVIPVFLIFILVALLISLSLVGIGVYVYYLMKGYDTSHFVNTLFKVEYPGAIKQFTIAIVVGAVLFFYFIWRKSVEREQILREENLRYKYKTLKSQLNPHFLFNSLNTLSELIYSDVTGADNFVQMLSGIYRYVLENEERDIVPLEDEITFVKNYFMLHKVRDNDKISLMINNKEKQNLGIIPVSLQLLLENALKHNSRSHENPLKIIITIEDDFVTVTNAIQRKNSIENSTQKGLLNLSDRVRLILGKELLVTEKEGIFTVKLPVTVIHNESINS